MIGARCALRRLTVCQLTHERIARKWRWPSAAGVASPQGGCWGQLDPDGNLPHEGVLKWSTTAAMAKTPPSRSYKLFSGAVCLSCACALSAAANTVTGGAAAPALRPRFVL